MTAALVGDLDTFADHSEKGNEELFQDLEGLKGHDDKRHELVEGRHEKTVAERKAVRARFAEYDTLLCGMPTYEGLREALERRFTTVCGGPTRAPSVRGGDPASSPRPLLRPPVRARITRYLGTPLPDRPGRSPQPESGDPQGRVVHGRQRVGGPEG